MRVTRQTLRPMFNRLDFLTIMQQVLLLKSTFKIGARIYTRCAMRLKENQVATVLPRTCAVTCFKKVIETGLK